MSGQQRGGKAVSLWIDTAAETDFPKLEGPLRVDVAIVGGGIAGLTVAAALGQRGSQSTSSSGSQSFPMAGAWD